MVYTPLNFNCEHTRFILSFYYFEHTNVSLALTKTKIKKAHWKHLRFRHLYRAIVWRTSKARFENVRSLAVRHCDLSGHSHSKIVPTWTDLSSLWESVHTRFDRSQIDLSSHSSVHIQIAFDLHRSQIDLTRPPKSGNPTWVHVATVANQFFRFVFILNLVWTHCFCFMFCETTLFFPK